MGTIIDELQHPSSIAKGTEELKSVLYVYSDAFTNCDCGKDLMLTQRVYGDKTYRGECSCGKRWALLNGKFKVY